MMGLVFDAHGFVARFIAHVSARVWMTMCIFVCLFEVSRPVALDGVWDSPAL